MNLPLITLGVVFVLIAARQVGPVRVDIWQVMLGGAMVVVLGGSISLADALQAINLDVILFLAAMFLVGNALEQSGYLAHHSFQYIKRAGSRDSMVVIILFVAGLASAVLMNDTLAIVGTPVVLLLARKHAMSPKVLLLALAFGVTIGSVMSPIGNPQNLLIAVGGPVANPFGTFFAWLLVPTLLNLWVTGVLVRRFFPDGFHDAQLRHTQEPIRNKQMAFLAKLSLQIILLLIAVKILIGIFALPVRLDLTTIGVAAALPVFVGSKHRWRLVRLLDWQTLVFFAAMFVLMESVWLTGVMQEGLQHVSVPLTSLPMIMAVGVVGSQIISNVPLVALYLPILREAGAGVPELMALAAASTIAGNLFILGAASNVIIIQNAERRSGTTLTFWDFARVGAPVTGVNALVYWLWFEAVSRLVA